MNPFCYPAIETLAPINLKSVTDTIVLLKSHKVLCGIINNNINTHNNWAKDSATTSRQIYARFIATNISARESLITDYMAYDNSLFVNAGIYLNSIGSDSRKEVATKLLLLFLALKENQIKCKLCNHELAPVLPSLAIDTITGAKYECILCSYHNDIQTDMNKHILKVFNNEKSVSTVNVDDFLT